MRPPSLRETLKCFYRDAITPCLSCISAFRHISLHNREPVNVFIFCRPFAGYPSDKPWLATYVNWGEKPCNGKYVRGVCVFGVADLAPLSTRKELFANKFYTDFQPLALDCLEAWIKHKEDCPPPDDLEYYRQLPFVLNS